MLAMDPVASDWGDFKIRPEQVVVRRNELTQRALFNEELGAVVQVADEDRAAFADLVERHALTECAQRIARPTAIPKVRVRAEGNLLAEWRWEELFDAWWSVTHAMQKLRDNPDMLHSAYLLGSRR